jgi:hypothetical protein
LSTVSDFSADLQLGFLSFLRVVGCHVALINWFCWKWMWESWISLDCMEKDGKKPYKV